MKYRRNTKVTITLTHQEAVWLHALISGVNWDDDQEDNALAQFIARLDTAVDLSDDCSNHFPDYFVGRHVKTK